MEGMKRCRLCGNLYRSFSENDKRICKRCRHRLEDIYGRVHEYLRDNEDEDFDIYKLGEAMDISTADIQALVDLGYLERDLKTYGNKATEREKLAAEFNDELEKMKKAPVTYGGEKYARGPERKKDKKDKKDIDEDNRHYVYDIQNFSRNN